VSDRSELRADCAACAGLCCAVPAFTASSDFAIDKPSGVPCPNLATVDFGCTIHDELRERGFPGCTVYDCFGAGQRVVQEHFDGRTWRTAPEIRDQQFATFEVVERLHELLWYLEDAASRRLPRELRAEVEGLRSAVERAAAEPDERNVVPLQLRADALLGEVSGAVRRGGRNLRGQDLAGRDLRDQGLTDADLRWSLLLGADLRGVRLGEADLLGADLRGADLRGADLSESLFLTRFQLRAGRCDDTTVVPRWAGR
jgi:Pentapeptide repeats (8 copies)